MDKNSRERPRVLIMGTRTDAEGVDASTHIMSKKR